jgi:hypothetical protein
MHERRVLFYVAGLLFVAAMAIFLVNVMRIPQH